MPISASISHASEPRNRSHPQPEGATSRRKWYHPLQQLCALLVRPFVRPLSKQVERLESELAVLNSCSIVSSTDASGRITHVNELFCKISGYTREELLGRNHSLVNSGYHNRKFFMDMYRTIATGQQWRGELRNRAKDGSHFWLDITIIPTTDGSGRVTRYTSVCVDITARKNAEEMLARLRERHKLAIDGSGICLWDWDLVRDMVQFDGNWCPMLGHPRNEVSLMSRAALDSAVHPDDLALTLHQVERHTKGETPFFECEARLRHVDGHWVSMLFRGSVNKRDQNGLALRISGTAIEISELKQAMRQAEQSEALLKTVIDLLPQRVFWKDRDGRFLGANRNFKIDAGVEELVGKTDGEVPWASTQVDGAVDTAAEGSADALVDLDHHIMETRQPVLNLVQQFTRGDHIEWRTTSKVPLIDARGEVWGVLGTYQDITPFKIVEAELIKARNAAESASRAKSDFLATMSHEIRTPMNGVIGFTDLLLQTSLTADQQNMASTIRDSGRALMSIIDDILDFSRIEAGRVTIERARIDARKIAQDVLTLLAPRAAEKQLDFDIQWPETVSSSLIADAGRLRQVLMNLASNAIKFTDSGRVTIRACADGDSMVRIEVADTGIGVTPEQLSRLFAKFTQADSSTTRRYGGTGLGLAISKQLVELMNGRIGASSEPGVGSTFWFTLPVAQRSENTGTHRVLTLDIPRAAADQPNSSAHPRVLIVEDHAVNRMLATRLLTKLGCEVDLAENGRLACDRTLQQNYDLIFMDCQMPEMDGFEATRVIRERERTGLPHTPIVALTANAMSQDKERCIEAGMDDYITKPYASADFERALQRWRAPQALPAVGIEKYTVAPRPSTPSAQVRPPCRCTIRRTLARPTPVPSKSLSACSRWNTPNRRSAYCILKPTPLSRT